MKKMVYQNVRGTQDYLAESEVIRRYVRRSLEDVFIDYGYKALETPVLNYTDLLASKYGGGAEILKEMYRLTDRGERDLALRYDLTIPFAKVMAMNPTLRLPFKRYEIGKVFRDGPIKAGRLREFTQCDIDIAGVASQVAEAELMMIALDAFKKLDVEVTIQYNNRQLLVGLLEVFDTPVEKTNRVILTIDKLAKVGVDSVIKELEEQNLASTTLKSIRGFLTNKNGFNSSYYESFANKNELVNKGLIELKELEEYLTFLGLADQCKFNPFLARGLDIYTGTIYEVFLFDKTITSSIGSGGRYDNAVGGLVGTNKQLPTVGLSFGLDVIYTYLVNQETIEIDDSVVDYYIIPLNTKKESLLVANYLRSKGYKVECELSDKKIGKALDKANKDNINKVIIIGRSEVESNVFKVKDMNSGEEIEQEFQYR